MIYRCVLYGAKPHAAGSLLPLISINGLISPPALPDSSVGFNPLSNIYRAAPLLKGLKSTGEEALPLIFKTVR